MRLKMFILPAILFMALAAFTFQHQQRANTCSACESLTGVEKVVCLAEDFKASLSATQIATLQLNYNLTNAAKWSNLPVTFVARLGIRLGDLNSTQLEKAKALIKASMGTSANEGYDEIEQLWAADQYLFQNGGGSTYGSGQYYLAFLGTPSMTGDWELQTGGHHLAVANTYSAGASTGVTPSFRAVEPFAAFQSGTNTYQPLRQERDALAAVLASLSSTQLTTAKLSSTFNDIVLGPGKDWQFPTTKAGLKCSELTQAQKDLVLAAIRTYVEDVEDNTADAYMALYTDQLDDTYIAYANTAGLSQQKDYIRIDGPRVWIEYSVQNGIVLTPTHPHSVWRDHYSDYGTLGNTSASGTHSAGKFEGKFELFPNPATTSIQVALELENAASVSIRLFDANGRLASAGIHINTTAGNHTLPLNVQQLPAGNYNCVVEIKNQDGSTSTATKTLTKA